MTANDRSFDARRKVRDRSLALLLAGICVLLPPVAGISLVDARVGGVPVPLLYIFFVWALLIAGAAMLARPLRDSDQAATSDEDGPTIT